MARGNFGERLKREREMREVSLDEICAATRIGTRFLQAMENEDWEKLPGGVFNRGFVRAVARYLGLDEESLLAEYDLARSQNTLPAASPASRPESLMPARWRPVLLFVLILILFLVGGIFGWRRIAAWRVAPHRRPASSAPANPAPPAVVSSTPITPTAPAPSRSSPSPSSSPLELSASAGAAVRVRIRADGKTLFDDDLSAGQTLRFHAEQEFEVYASDSSAVFLELNGQAMPPLGSPGASGTITLSQRDLKRGAHGSNQP